MKDLLERAGWSERFFVDSAGTGAYHVGEPADPRSAAAARKRGVQLTSVARMFTPEDFAAFDYIVAMDRRNLVHMQRMASSPADAAKLSLLRTYDAHADAPDVPDPYFEDNFDEVFDICRAGCAGLLEQIAKTHGLSQ